MRPILDYASPVWCLYLVKNIVLLEKVQRRASRLALGQRRGEMSYEDRCEMLRWSQLTDRRLYFSDQFSYLGNRAQYEFIELDMSTGLDKQMELRKPSSIRVYRSRYINRPRWTNRPRETVLDMSIPSSNCRGRWSKDSHFSGGTSRMLSSSISLTIALEFS